MYELSLKENEIDFKSLEQEIYKFVCQQACNIMADTLERSDKKLLEERDMPEAPEGLTYRHSGTAEHNICDVLAQRMKGRKMSWSIKGVNNLSKILAEKFSGRLYSTINEVLGGIVPDEKLEEIAEVVTLTAAIK